MNMAIARGPCPLDPARARSGCAAQGACGAGGDEPGFGGDAGDEGGCRCGAIAGGDGPGEWRQFVGAVVAAWVSVGAFWGICA